MPAFFLRKKNNRSTPGPSFFFFYGRYPILFLCFHLSNVEIEVSSFEESQCFLNFNSQFSREEEMKSLTKLSECMIDLYGDRFFVIIPTEKQSGISPPQ